ncbi:MAG TPA: sugar ABC transporter substrate-binding protein, partial [Roseiflexaceae bacterium]|nr:sugar ABC transporter substrate-binding protein [Roseiflexaceae bacterium]
MVSRKGFGALLLMLALLVPILAACGGGGTSGAATSAPAPGAATAAPAAEAPTAAAAPTTAAEPTAASAGAAPTAMAEATSAPEAGGAPAGATAGASGDATKIQVEDGATLRVSSWGDPSEQKVNTDAFARFNKLFPNVKINYEPQPKDFQTKMKADVAGGTEPDVFYLDSSLMTAFAPNGALLPLDDVMQTAGVKADDYLGDLIKLFQQDGKTYALPKDQGSLALFVNDDMAQKAGVDVKNLKTWDDVTAAAKKMTSGEGPGKTYGLCDDPDVQRVSAFILQSGAVIENNKAAFNQAGGVKAVEWWYGFKKDGTGEAPKNIGSDWCGDAFSKKKVAMVAEGGWMLPFMQQQAPDVKFTAVPLPLPPSGGKQATLVFTNGWAASARTKYPKAAAALILYLTSAANQKPILETGFALPTVKSLTNDPYFQTNPNAKVLADAPSYGSVADLVFGGPAKKEDVIKALKEQAFEPIFLNGADIKSSLDTAAQAVDQVLSS